MRESGRSFHQTTALPSAFVRSLQDRIVPETGSNKPTFLSFAQTARPAFFAAHVQ
jgi:hypothetical protein